MQIFMSIREFNNFTDGLNIHACDFDEDGDMCGYTSRAEDYCSDHYYWQQSDSNTYDIPPLSGKVVQIKCPKHFKAQWGHSTWILNPIFNSACF